MDELELALDECLRQLASGKVSLGQCLARYPQYATELRPILETAMRVQQGKVMRPSGAVRARARRKIANYIETHPRQPRKVRVVPRLAFVMVTLALALMLVGTGFAQAALPGQPLYRLKLSTEKAWRAASPDPLQTDLMLANRRTDELLTLASDSTGTVSQKDAESQGIAAYTDVLNRLASETNGPDGSQILSILEAHQNKLSKAGINVPELDTIVSHGNQGQGQGNGNGNGNGGGNGGNGNGGGNGGGNGNNP